MTILDLANTINRAALVIVGGLSRVLRRQKHEAKALKSLQDASAAFQAQVNARLDEFGKTLAEIHDAVISPDPIPDHFVITLEQENPLTMATKTLDASVDFQLLDDGTAVATLTTADKAGNPIPFPQGASLPSWSASDASVTVTPADDGQSAVIADNGTLVNGVTISVTSTLADGSTVINGTSDPLDVVADNDSPTSFKVTLSRNTPQA